MKELLIKLNACSYARDFAEGLEIEQVIDTCERGDWLLWLAKRVDMDIRLLTLAKARCAKTVIHLMKDQRSVNAVNVAESFGLGNANSGELAAAAAAAYAAYSAADDDADEAAYSAAAAADEAATDDVAYVAYVAYVTAAAAAAAAAAADESADAARTSNQKSTAQICRDTFRDELIRLVNKAIAEMN